MTGMTCAACSARVEKAVRAVPGVTECAVSLLTNSMSVEGTADSRTVVAAVQAAGYGAAVKGAQRSADATDKLTDRESPALLRRLISSVVFLLVLMYISMGHTMWSWPLPGFLAQDHVAMGLAQLLLTGIVMVINQRFFISGFKALWHRSPNMDTLVALGAGAAFVYSTYALFAMSAAQVRGDMAAVTEHMHGLYFESAAMILTLITVGKMLEARSKGKTTDALRGLLAMKPKTAVLLTDQGEQTVPIEQVKPGDRFVVRSGETIPTDGEVLEGSGAVDEAALTGESLPVDKTVGDRVSAATINRSGYMVCQATRVGEDTTLSQIIHMVENAAATKAPIAKLADRVSGVFVPTVMGIAAVTFLVWLLTGATVGHALARGISVLVISCPCALGLATPVAIMVGSGVGARHGVLFKTAASLEQTGRTRIVALDKTGTITKGEPVVTDILAGAADEKTLLAAAYGLESKSEHPLAGAICRLAQERRTAPAPVEDFQVLPGNGLTAVWQGQPLLAGKEAFVARRVTIPNEIRQQANALAEEGKTPLFFARGDALLGVIAVADVIKEDSAAAIRELQQLGLRVVMITGDNRRTAEAIGRQAGVDEVIAGVLPGGKEEAIRTLSRQGATAMVGDGINDAPALTRADTGIAVGAGADVALDAADVVLMHSRLSDVPAAIRLSRATLRNIRENLFWAFIYNVIGIPLAAGVFSGWLGWELNPMFGAAAMSLSSFCVVTNALRLNFFRFSKPGAVSAPVEHEQITVKETSTMTKTLKIEGMTCGHCEAHVKGALEALDGVTGAQVSHETGTAVVTLSHEVADDTLKAAVEAQGYKVL